MSPATPRISPRARDRLTALAIRDPFHLLEGDDDLAALVGDAGEHLRELLADHELDDRLEARPLHVPGADVPAVPEDRVAVGDLLDLLQEMADVDDADVLRP